MAHRFPSGLRIPPGLTREHLGAANLGVESKTGKLNFLSADSPLEAAGLVVDQLRLMRETAKSIAAGRQTQTIKRAVTDVETSVSFGGAPSTYISISNESDNIVEYVYTIGPLSAETKSGDFLPIAPWGLVRSRTRSNGLRLRTTAGSAVVVIEVGR